MNRLMVFLLLAGMAFGAPPKPIPGWATPQHRFSFLRTMFDTRTGGGAGASYPCCSDNGTNFISTEAILVPSGTTLLPGIANSTQSSTGIVLGSSASISLSMGGNRTYFYNATQATMGSGVAFGWSNGADGGGGSFDVTMGRRSSGNLRLGAVDLNGAPTAQAISVTNAITGSNLAGAATFSLIASLGTGIGTPGVFQVQGAAMGTTGTTAQVAVTRFALNDTKQLTSAAASTALSVPLPTLQMMGGTIDYYIEATDGTNQCTSKNTVEYAGENSAGVFKVTVTKVIATSVTNCTGAATLTEAWTITSADPALIQVTPTLSFGAPTLFQMVYEVHHMGRSAPTL